MTSYDVKLSDIRRVVEWRNVQLLRTLLTIGIGCNAYSIQNPTIEERQIIPMAVRWGDYSALEDLLSANLPMPDDRGVSATLISYHPGRHGTDGIAGQSRCGMLLQYRTAIGACNSGRFGK